MLEEERAVDHRIHAEDGGGEELGILAIGERSQGDLSVLATPPGESHERGHARGADAFFHGHRVEERLALGSGERELGDRRASSRRVVGVRLLDQDEPRDPSEERALGAFELSKLVVGGQRAVEICGVHGARDAGSRAGDAAGEEESETGGVEGRGAMHAPMIGDRVRMAPHARIGVMSQRLVVFISSTVEDLGPVRRALGEALAARGADVRLSEAGDFPVEPGVSSHDACLRAVRASHVFVLLVGSRFGGDYQGQNKSITWREWEEAMDAGLLPIVLVNQETNDLARAIYGRRVALQREHPGEPVVEIDARLRKEEAFRDQKPKRHNLPGVQRFIDALRKGHADNWTHLDWDGTAAGAMPKVDARLASALAVAQRRAQNVRATAERERHRTEAVHAISGVTANLAIAVAAGVRSREQAVALLLDAWVSYRHELLSFRGEDRHNFVVYVRDGDVLRPVHRKAHHAIPVHGRSWAVGQGHVGTCVAENRLMVSGDIRNTEAWVPAEARRTDRDHYVSAVSVPFSYGTPTDDPEGALIVTSNRVDHFRSPHQVEVLTVGTLANMLTLLLTVEPKDA